MKQQHDRTANAIRNELKRPKRNFNDNPTTLLARVALGVVYMYLILMSYELLGITGPVFVSVLFLVSFFIPAAYNAFSGRQEARKEETRKEEESKLAVTDEARQEG